MNSGKDLALFTSGICTEEARKVVEVLAAKGLSIEHLHVSTLKPFTDPQIRESLGKVRYGAITLENHSVVGGLGTAVAEVIAEESIPCRLVRMGIRDKFLHGASRTTLARENQMEGMSLVGEIEKLTGQTFGISAGDLGSVHLTPVHSEAKAEAL